MSAKKKKQKKKFDLGKVLGAGDDQPEPEDKKEQEELPQPSPPAVASPVVEDEVDDLPIDFGKNKKKSGVRNSWATLPVCPKQKTI